MPGSVHPRLRETCDARVLIATLRGDDSRVLAEFLERCGFEVESALDALDCLELLQMQPAHLLVMEDQLLWGGSDGVLARLRGDLRELNPAVILIGNRPHTSATLAPPVADYLRKPVEPESMVRARPTSQGGISYIASIADAPGGAEPRGLTSLFPVPYRFRRQRVRRSRGA
jgi:CheY-like chemotaxis protein